MPVDSDHPSPSASVQADEFEVLGGLNHQRTLGSPVSVVIRNTEWEKWSDVMSTDEPNEQPKPLPYLIAVGEAGGACENMITLKLKEKV